MSAHFSTAGRPPFDPLLQQIADYVCDFNSPSEEALDTARYCLLDTLGCGLLALKYPACTKLLGPVVPGTIVPNGARVPGTDYVLDPVTAAFNIGTLVRWLDFNDTWLAAEWGHPSDNLGAILAVADYSTRNAERGMRSFTVHDVLLAMIKAHEIQGVLALENGFNRVGLDHVLLVRIASTAIATHLLGGTREQIMNAVSNAWLDGGALRTYRHAPNAGSRKSWAAGDATARAVQHGLMAIKGEMGYPSALTAPKWGFSDVLFKSQPVKLARAFGSYVMENVLFKISFPAEFHAQTAVEAAFKLHEKYFAERGPSRPAALATEMGAGGLLTSTQAKVEALRTGTASGPLKSLDQVERVEIHTHESAIRIIDKTGPLHNPADRDHCLQYMVAVGLIFGELTADHYEDSVAADSRIDTLRGRMVVKEESRYTREYLEADKRSIANALQIFFHDGTSTEKVEVEYPVGHRRRRAEGIPLLVEKFSANAATCFPSERVQKLLSQASDTNLLKRTQVNEFVDYLVPKT